MSDFFKSKASPYGNADEKHGKKEFDQAQFADSLAVFARDLFAGKIRPAVDRLADCERQSKNQNTLCSQIKSEIVSHSEKLKDSVQKAVADILASTGKRASAIDLEAASSDWKPAVSFYAGIEEGKWLGDLSRRIDHVLKTAAWINKVKKETKSAYVFADKSHGARLDNLASIAASANQACARATETFTSKKLRPVKGNLVVKDPKRSNHLATDVDFNASVASCNQILREIKLAGPYSESG